MTPHTLLSIQNVSKTYPGQDRSRPVLRNVSLELQAGTSIALTGESGSGKSTLLHMAGALDTYDSGEIRVNGTSLTGLNDSARAALRRSDISLVFQQFNLVPSLTVSQNLSLHARMAGQPDQTWIDLLTKHLGLADLGSRYPEQLSGGQQQRVAIGRALALRPKLLLADEPTGNLDEATSAAVMDLMLNLVKESGAALFLVTHSEKIASQLDRRVHLSQGEIT